MTLTPRRGDPSVRKVVASLSLSLDYPAEQPDELVTEVDDAMDENLRSLSR